MNEDFKDSRSRLLHVIKLSGLNGKEFADKVEVSPSTISQITSTSEKARKTELSDKVVTKIISAFPQFNLSYEWLLNGVGPITNSPARQPSLFDDDIIFGGATSASTPQRDSQRDYYLVDDATKNSDSYGTVDVNSATDVLMAADEHDIGPNSAPPTQDRRAEPIQQPRREASAFVRHQLGDVPPPPPPASPTVPIDIPVPPEASIERIVIFYSDGTFADYKPRR